MDTCGLFPSLKLTFSLYSPSNDVVQLLTLYQRLHLNDGRQIKITQPLIMNIVFDVGLVLIRVTNSLFVPRIEDVSQQDSEVFNALAI